MKCLWSEVSDDVLHSGDGRKGRCTIAFFAETLSDAGMDEVSEVFREPCLLCSIYLDDVCGLRREFGALGQVALKRVGIHCRATLSRTPSRG
jgi:hypothetical protein